MLRIFEAPLLRGCCDAMLAAPCLMKPSSAVLAVAARPDRESLALVCTPPRLREERFIARFR
jgi:hypothetical protein